MISYRAFPLVHQAGGASYCTHFVLVLSCEYDNGFSELLHEICFYELSLIKALHFLTDSMICRG